MKRVITAATFALLLITSFSFASAQCPGNGNGNGNGNGYGNNNNSQRALLRNYVRKLNRLEYKMDYANYLSHSIIAAYNSCPAQAAPLSNQLRVSINRLNGPINALTNIANALGEQGLITQTARLALFPSLLQAGAMGGSSSTALTPGECSSICTLLEDMARITGDDIRVEIQSIRSNF